jgi:hypothetical protein
MNKNKLQGPTKKVCVVCSKVLAKNLPLGTDDLRKLSFRIQETCHEIQLLNHPIAKLSSYYSSSTHHRTRSAVCSGFMKYSLLPFGIRDFFTLWMCVLFTLWELSVNLFRG